MRARALALPMPLLAPVTIATFCVEVMVVASRGRTLAGETGAVNAVLSIDGPADRPRLLRGRPAALLPGPPVGALRRRPRAPQHRPRVHRPPPGRAARGAHRPLARPRGRGRDPHLRRARGLVVTLRPLPGRARGRPRRARGHHARAVAALLRGALRA